MEHIRLGKRKELIYAGLVCFHVERMEATTLRQIREMLGNSRCWPGNCCVLANPFKPERWPSASKVSRNTVMVGLSGTGSDGYLEARERSGFYVSAELS